MTAIRETDIRPDELMARQVQAQAADIAWLLERRSAFVEVRCPACDAVAPAPALEKHGFTYARCPRCETLYMNPRPSAPLLHEFYETSANYAYWNEHIFPASEEARRTKIFRPRVERLVELVERYGTRTRTLLEVGAGFGTFCDELKARGLFDRVIGVEPTPHLAQSCRERGVEVVERPIEQVEFDEGQADVVASFETIEHLFSPRAFVERCADLLAPGGLLVLTCPSVKGFDVVVLGSASGVIDNEHLNYFTPRSLARLVASCGFRVSEVSTPGKLDAEIVRKRALAGEVDLDRQPFLREILIDEWERVGDAFQEFLAANQLSSHMWLVARKPEVNG
jgi:2-polyprenyl-3-methyl-5-hydroxy-6-metoxy-1,4-benzoquinol methylase